MAYDKKYIGEKEVIKTYLDGREDRIGSEFNNVENVLLLAQAKGWNIEWERKTFTFSASGYASGSTKKRMSDPESAIVIPNLASYGNRKHTINAWTVANNPTLIEFYVHDETGKVVTGDVSVSYIVIYK